MGIRSLIRHYEQERAELQQENQRLEGEIQQLQTAQTKLKAEQDNFIQYATAVGAYQICETWLGEHFKKEDGWYTDLTNGNFSYRQVIDLDLSEIANAIFLRQMQIAWNESTIRDIGCWIEALWDELND